MADESDNSRILIVKFMPPNILPWGSYGAGPNQFKNPQDVKVHYSTGNIFVCDTGNDRVQRFTRTTGPIPTWPGMTVGPPGIADGEFKAPSAIAVDATSSDLFVSDKGNNRIQKITSTGKFIKKYDGIWSTGIAVDSERNVYVSVAGMDRIYKFTSELDLITEWGPPGTANGEFRNPRGIAVDFNNDVYVVDSGNFRVQKFTKDGQHIKSWTHANSGGGVFRIPYGIAFDGSTNGLHVSDNSYGIIQTFTQNGGFIQKISL